MTLGCQPTGGTPRSSSGRRVTRPPVAHWTLCSGATRKSRPASGAFARDRAGSDGASKRRWIWLPPGTQTRRHGLGQFHANEAGKESPRQDERNEAPRAPAGRLDRRRVSLARRWFRRGGAVRRDRRARHSGDVPASNVFDGCHAGRSSHVLGFPAVQLAEPSEADALSLEELVRSELVSQVPVATLGARK